MDNDDLRDDDLYKFLKAIYENYARHTIDNPALYTCYASVNHVVFEKALDDAGYRVKQQLIWEKGHVLGRSDYHWSHEPILYCMKIEGETPDWYGDRTHRTTLATEKWPDIEKLTKDELLSMLVKIRLESDVLHVAKDATSEYLHSTQKPVDLPRTHILNSSRPTDVVLDFCGGSGTTLIACESTKRTTKNNVFSWERIRL